MCFVRMMGGNGIASGLIFRGCRKWESTRSPAVTRPTEALPIPGAQAAAPIGAQAWAQDQVLTMCSRSGVHAYLSIDRPQYSVDCVVTRCLFLSQSAIWGWLHRASLPGWPFGQPACACAQGRIATKVMACRHICMYWITSLAVRHRTSLRRGATNVSSTAASHHHHPSPNPPEPSPRPFPAAHPDLPTHLPPLHLAY